MNSGLKKDLKNNGGSFQLSVIDIFGTERYNVRYGTITEEAFDIKSHVIVYTESTRFPIIRLTYSRSFGTSKSRPQALTVPGEEQERVRKD